MTLDYTLNTAERIAHLATLDLKNMRPAQLEFLANWALHEDKYEREQREKHVILHPTNHKSTSRLDHLKQSKDISSDAIHPNEVELQRTHDTTRYIAPPKPINWTKPHMRPFKEAIDILSAMEKEATGPTKWKLKQWLVELRVDAGICNSTYLNTISINPPPSRPQPPTLDHLNIGDPFVVKHIIELYWKLKQDGTEDTQLFLSYFEQIVDTAPLKAWQYDVVKLKCEGAKGVAIAKEIYTVHERNLSPQSLSNSLRSIYRIIADWARQAEQEWLDRRDPAKWRKCSVCGQKKHNSPYHWHKGRNECKVCRAEKREHKLNETRTSKRNRVN